ncbi:golgin subfamily A member 6-like protein 22 [Colossoma macropomum]|uniref:golgin subfamily A member 6-like protein 22 n=1 Tax=Colossoma macropomum TaxID=42526 RepID=UPI0018642337|nr:golgin subfamily A member 6-like protein 22 [Colossoma macropomum]
MLEKMEEIFGERCWRNTMILFTVTDEVQEKNIEEFIQSGNQEVQRLVEKCRNRFHCLSIKESGDGSQISELLEKIDKMVAGNEEGFYSSDIYHEIREMEKRIIKEREENNKREIRKFKEKQEKEIQDALKRLTEQIQELEKRLQQHEERKTELESLLKEERNDETKRELEMKLQREIQPKEEIQQQLKELKEKWDKMKSEIEERHRQEMADIIAMYEGKARMEAERNLMNIILPELHRTVWVLISKMQKQFLVKVEQKDRELLTLKQRLSELTETYRQLEIDYQALRSTESTEAGRGEERVSAAAVGGDGGVEETQDEVERLSEAGQVDGDEKGSEEERRGDKDRGEAEKTEAGEEEENRPDGQEESRGRIRRIFCCCFPPVYEPVEMQQM